MKLYEPDRCPRAAQVPLPHRMSDYEEAGSRPHRDRDYEEAVPVRGRAC
jgi:hypothetical protein